MDLVLESEELPKGEIPKINIKLRNIGTTLLHSTIREQLKSETNLK